MLLGCKKVLHETPPAIVVESAGDLLSSVPLGKNGQERAHSCSSDERAVPREMLKTAEGQKDQFRFCSWIPNALAA
jgi:hypothetical protein